MKEHGNNHFWFRVREDKSKKSTQANQLLGQYMGTAMWGSISCSSAIRPKIEGSGLRPQNPQP